MSLKYSEYIRHILEELRFVSEQTQSLDFEAFCADQVLKKAVVRSLKIVGEASKQITEELRHEYSAFDWRGFAGLRDRLIHHYFGIDYEIL